MFMLKNSNNTDVLVWVLLAASNKILNQLPKKIGQLLSDIAVCQRESRLWAWLI